VVTLKTAVDKPVAGAIPVVDQTGEEERVREKVEGSEDHCFLTQGLLRSNPSPMGIIRM
jgi:hypothetical protein